MKQLILLAPWWLDDRHVGNRRLRRHVRWLSDDGWKTTVICAGPEFQLRENGPVTELVLPDPLKIHGPAVPEAAPARRPSTLRRWLAYALLVPDPAIVWTRAAVRHPIVRHRCRTADLITASSPPEAPFLGALSLARRYRTPFWMDMRDGWLDEPLKPLLRRHAWQRWRERRLESACLRGARRITVTSEAWRSMLVDRYPDIGPNIHVVTNAAPDANFEPHPAPAGIAYAGRFGSSRPERSIRTLAAVVPELDVIGDLTAPEIDDVRRLGWPVKPARPSEELPQVLSGYGGLALLSESTGSIPAKFYEYLSAGRPILAVCPTESAAWTACADVPHAYRVDPAAPDPSVLSAFHEASRQPGRHPVPVRFSGSAVRDSLRSALEGL